MKKFKIGLEVAQTIIIIFLLIILFNEPKNTYNYYQCKNVEEKSELVCTVEQLGRRLIGEEEE